MIVDGVCPAVDTGEIKILWWHLEIDLIVLLIKLYTDTADLYFLVWRNKVRCSSYLVKINADLFLLTRWQRAGVWCSFFQKEKATNAVIVEMKTPVYLKVKHFL